MAFALVRRMLLHPCTQVVVLAFGIGQTQTPEDPSRINSPFYRVYRPGRTTNMALRSKIDELALIRA